jgi:hypothetical protein
VINKEIYHIDDCMGLKFLEIAGEPFRGDITA